MRVWRKRELGLDKESDLLCSGILAIGAISSGNAHDPTSHHVCKCFSSTPCFSRYSNMRKIRPHNRIVSNNAQTSKSLRNGEQRNHCTHKYSSDGNKNDLC